MLNQQHAERQLDAFMNELQARDSVKMFHGLVERCFYSCVNDFSSKTLTNKEEQCIYRCSDKWIKHTMRVARAFADHAALMQQQAESAAEAAEKQPQQVAKK